MCTDRRAGTWLLAALSALLLPSAAAGQESPLNAHMAEHLDRAAALQAAIVQWDVDGIADHGSWLAEHVGSRGLPPGAAEYTQAMRQSARQAAAATTAEEAGAALGAMGAACNACHTRWNVTPDIPVVPAPEEGDEAQAHMQRHVWGAARMWEGLVGRSDPLWHSGAQAFSEAALVPEGLPAGTTDDLVELASRAHELATEAGRASDATRRATLYGQLVATCGTCHQAVAAQATGEGGR